MAVSRTPGTTPSRLPRPCSTWLTRWLRQQTTWSSRPETTSALRSGSPLPAGRYLPPCVAGPPTGASCFLAVSQIALFCCAANSSTFLLGCHRPLDRRPEGWRLLPRQSSNTPRPAPGRSLPRIGSARPPGRSRSSGFRRRSGLPVRRSRKRRSAAATGKKLKAFCQAFIHSAVCSAARSNDFFCNSATCSTPFR